MKLKHKTKSKLFFITLPLLFFSIITLLRARKLRKLGFIIRFASNLFYDVTLDIKPILLDKNKSMSESFVKNKIEKGKQVGGWLWSDIEGVKYYESAGIQKWGESFRVGIFKIAEENMVQEIFEIDEVKEFPTLTEAIEYLEDNSPITFDSMNTCKGQRIFNPDVIYSERNFDPYK